MTHSGSRPSSLTWRGLQVGSLLTHSRPLGLSLHIISSGKQVPQAVVQVAHCTHLGDANHSIDIIDTHFLWQFPAVGSQVSWEKGTFFFVWFTKPCWWDGTECYREAFPNSDWVWCPSYLFQKDCVLLPSYLPHFTLINWKLLYVHTGLSALWGQRLSCSTVPWAWEWHSLDDIRWTSEQHSLSYSNPSLSFL